VALGYYAAYGSLNGFDPLKDQEQQFFPSIDVDLGPQWEFNFRVGVGATGSTDHLIITCILWSASPGHTTTPPGSSHCQRKLVIDRNAIQSVPAQAATAVVQGVVAKLPVAVRDAAGHRARDNAKRKNGLNRRGRKPQPGLKPVKVCTE
jgi:hypothetical protein